MASLVQVSRRRRLLPDGFTKYNKPCAAALARRIHMQMRLKSFSSTHRAVHRRYLIFRSGRPPTFKRRNTGAGLKADGVKRPKKEPFAFVLRARPAWGMSGGKWPIGGKLQASGYQQKTNTMHASVGWLSGARRDPEHSP